MKTRLMTVFSFCVCLCFAVFREGLEWTDIDWMDNGECLDLIEKVAHSV